ncbi:MAG: UvrD-helicase domain-containing protein [Gammaproteobacteria bacterium]|nr:UvrD-helicase domain-containing protein [Gammaproteobacteria bacterium]
MSITPTPEQRKIIDHPLEPLRVAAGAGTGKTTTIAMRLAALVRRDDLEPETALGITFTNKAAEELADKLRLHLPEFAREGREVEVTTYHGFAHRIVGEFGPMVGIARNITVIGSGYQRELLREALGAESPELLDLTSPARRVDELVALTARLGDHLRFPSDVLALHPGDEVEAARREMASVLERYDALKRRLGVADYSDLIRYGYEIVSEPSIGRRIRDRYRVVLLDEYQDTNPAQRELLLQLFGDGFPVTAVGDPDQTIYEWRGASLENFSAFPDHFTVAGKRAKTLTLGVNRRSDRRIIDAANAVKERIGDSQGVERLVARSDAQTGTVSLAWFHAATDEAAWIAREVRRLHDHEGVQWRDMALLFRKNRTIPLLREALEALDIPVEVAALGGLLQVPEVVDLHAWMRLIGHPDDTPSLVRILLGSHYRLGMSDLVPLVRRSRERGTTMLVAIDGEQTELPETAQRRLARFRERYRTLLTLAQGVTLVELARRILDVTGTWAEVEALEGSRRLSARLNLYRFLDLAEEWSPLEGRPSLEAFLDYLDLLQQDATSEELDTATLSGEDAVSLLTVHRAKGLEWSAVFIPAVCHGTFPSFARGGFDDPQRYPKSLPAPLRIDHVADDTSEAALRSRHDAQEWRTAYVAVTRAKHHLVLTGAHWYTTGRPKKPSALFDTIARLDGVTVEPRVREPGKPPELLRTDPRVTTPDPLFPEGWEAAFESAATDPGWLEGLSQNAEGFATQQRRFELVLDELPKNPRPIPEQPLLKVSVTNLVTYATCPKRYFWTVVDPLPRRPSHAARRGIEIHRRIELHNLGAVPLTDAEGYDLVTGDHPPKRDPFATYLSSRFAADHPRFVELGFELVLSPTVTVKGRIDAIYETSPGTWEIVDFKTGRRSANPAAEVQLEAYAVAAHMANLATDPPLAVEVTFAYLGDGLDVVTEHVDETRLGTAREHLESLTEAILDGEFAQNPSSQCQWCDFLTFCPAGRAFLRSSDTLGDSPR